MKNLFYLLCSLVVSSSFAQESFVIPTDKYLYDIPGNNFMLTYSSGDFIFIEEHSSENEIIWKDSLDHSYIPGGSPAYISRHTKISNDQYVFAYQKVENGMNSVYDTMATIFVKFSLSEQSILDYNTVFVPHELWGGFVQYDSVIVMSYTQRFLINPNSSMRKRIYYKLDEELNFEQMEDSDTIDYTSDRFKASLVKDDTIYQYFSLSDYFSSSSLLRVEKFNSSFQRLSYVYKSFNMGGTDPLLIFKNNNPDSLFYFQTQNNRLSFKWLDMHFNVNLEKNIYFPQYAEISNPVLIDDIIYVAVRQGMNVRIHKYNLLFNEICATFQLYQDIPPLNSNYIAMSALNNKPFLVVTRYSNKTYIPMTECEILSIEENKTIDFNVYPNPVESSFTVEFPDANTYELSIYNLQGQLVKDYGSFMNQATIDVESYDSGIYFLKVTNGNDYTMKKIVKQ